MVEILIARGRVKGGEAQAFVERSMAELKPDLRKDAVDLAKRFGDDGLVWMRVLALPVVALSKIAKTT